jgi:hypothetical protein
MSTYIGDLRATLYEPKGDLSYFQKDLECTPRFLFRTHSPRSSGETNPTYVRSPGALLKYEDILSQEREFSKSMIQRHLTTFTRPTEDNLMSWTTSLLLESRRRRNLDPRYI